jgi:hypothetical protein
LTECVGNSNTPNGSTKSDGTFDPPSVTGFQNWGNRIPFVPLFIEWEGLYYHAGPMKDKRDIELRPTAVGHHHPTVRYTPKEVLSDNAKNHEDFRTVSGRVLVLPQPVFSLQALVNQVLDDASNNSGLTDTDKGIIRDHIQKIQFVSAPLSGLTNHLLTRVEGAHVKPNVRTQDPKDPGREPALLEAMFCAALQTLEQNPSNLGCLAAGSMQHYGHCSHFSFICPLKSDSFLMQLSCLPSCHNLN